MADPATAQTEEQQAEALEQKFLAGELTDDAGDPKADDPAADEPEADESAAAPESDDDDAEITEEGPAVKEAKRLRAKNREVTEEIEALRKQVQALAAAPVPEAKAPETKTEEARFAAATLDELLDAEIALDERLAAAQQAGETEMVQRVLAVKRQVRAEQLRRPSQEITKQQRVTEAQEQWQTLEQSVVEALPDLKDASSTLHKQIVEFKQQNTALFEQLGEHVGGLVATAAVVAQMKTPSQSKPKATGKNLVKDMEAIAQGTMAKSGATTSPKSSKALNVDAMSDKDFEDLSNKIQRGEITFASLT